MIIESRAIKHYLLCSLLIYTIGYSTATAEPNTLVSTSQEEPNWIALSQDGLAKKHPLIIIFSHGFGDNQHQSKPYRNRGYFSEADILYTFNYLDAPASRGKKWGGFIINALSSPNLLGSYIGQGKDIEALETAIKTVHTAYPDGQIVLYGVSRGAATIANTLAHLGKTGEHELLGAIKGAVIESAFAETQDVIAAILPMIPTSIKKPLFTLIYSNHSFSGIQPITFADYIPPTIPLLFLATKQDKLIPAYSTYRLYEYIAKKRPTGTVTQFIEFNHGAHANIFSDEYLNAVTAFLGTIKEIK